MKCALSNTISDIMFQVDIVSPPVGPRGPLPPLQRVPHINSTSMDDKVSLSQEDSLSSNLVAFSDSKISVPEVCMDPEISDVVELEKEEMLSTSGLKSTPDTISMTEVVIFS